MCVCIITLWQWGWWLCLGDLWECAVKGLLSRILFPDWWLLPLSLWECVSVCVCISEQERLRGRVLQVSPQCNQSPARHEAQRWWITPFNWYLVWLHIFFCIFIIFLADKERTHSAFLLYFQERKIIINFTPWQLNHMAQTALHKPPHPPQTHTRTHGWPHQDTVLHMNSGLNSILLGLPQQINRSSAATGNNILGPRRLKGANQPKRQHHTRQGPNRWCCLHACCLLYSPYVRFCVPQCNCVPALIIYTCFDLLICSENEWHVSWLKLS